MYTYDELQKKILDSTQMQMQDALASLQSQIDVRIQNGYSVFGSGYTIKVPIGIHDFFRKTLDLLGYHIKITEDQRDGTTVFLSQKSD